MAKWLTKSNFNAFRVHPAKLWLAKYAPDKLPPWDDAAEARAVEGRQIEALARSRWPEGLLIDGSLFDMPDITAAAIASGVEVIFEAAVLTSRKLYAAADALVRQPDGRWDLYEIKSATRVKDDHLHDVAFQVAALREGGIPIGRSFVMYVNASYVRLGEIDPSQLIAAQEITEQVEALQSETLSQIDEAIAVMAGPCPPLDVSRAGNYHAWMEVMRHLKPNLPPDSIFNLCRLSGPQLASFKTAGFSSLSDIPLDFPELKPAQLTHLKAVAADTPLIDAEAINARLEGLTWPLYFLDYETSGPAVPRFDGTKPYQALPFQYSLDVLTSPTAKMLHYEYLATGPEHPAPGLVAQLQRDLGPTGSVIVWYKDFESARNDELGVMYPEAKDFFAGVNERIFDLMEVFSDGLYADKAFKGSASIKAVMPVVVPHMSYKNLGIQEGNAASRSWFQAATGELEPEAAAKVYADLLTYCGQDTLAMVEIYHFLIRTIGATLAK